MHQIFLIAGYPIESYALFTFLAFAAASVYYYFALKAIPIKKSQVWTYLFLRAFVSYLGGAILPFAYRWFYLHKAPWIDIWNKPPGRYFHSVVLSLLIYTLIVCKMWRWPTRKVLDIFAIGTLLASSIGRAGCLFWGCCYGKPCDLPWAIRFPSHPEIARHPTQIYMIILEALLALYLFSFHKKSQKEGETFWVGVGLYSVYRFLIEFLRTNPIVAWGLTHAQLFSIFCAALSAIVLVSKNREPHTG